MYVCQRIHSLYISLSIIFQSLDIYWDLFHVPAYGFYWWIFHMHLCIILCSVLWISVRSRWLTLFFLLYPYWFYWIFVLSISERGLLIYSTIIVDLFHSPFTFVNFIWWNLMLLLVAHIFRIILSSWKITLLITCNAICLEFHFIYVNRAVLTYAYCFRGIFFIILLYLSCL